MKLSELMAGLTPNPDYSGEIMTDDMLLAVNVATDSTGKVGDYIVVQDHITSVGGQLNPESDDKNYIRTGKSTSKKSTQRTFSVSGDRKAGDAFQDAMMEHKMLYGTGQDVVADYVYFCMKNGKGEQGKVCICVNSDSSGDAGANASIDIEMKGTGVKPTEYTYAKESV